MALNTLVQPARPGARPHSYMSCSSLLPINLPTQWGTPGAVCPPTSVVGHPACMRVFLKRAVEGHSLLRPSLSKLVAWWPEQAAPGQWLALRGHKHGLTHKTGLGSRVVCTQRSLQRGCVFNGATCTKRNPLLDCWRHWSLAYHTCLTTTKIGQRTILVWQYRATSINNVKNDYSAVSLV
jgi:hypothetical protein